LAKVTKGFRDERKDKYKFLSFLVTGLVKKPKRDALCQVALKLTVTQALVLKFG